MIVGKAIYYLLTNATGVTDIVSTRVYPEVAQQDAALPYIVYNVANNEPTDTKPEPSKLDTAQVEVNIYSDSYTEAIDLAVAVRAALDRVKGTYNGVNVQSIQYLNEIIDFDEPQRAYNINADYDVRISRSGFEIAQGSPITGVELGELSDVNVSGATDNQVLSYDAASDTWVAADDAGGAEVLNDLADVDAGQPEPGQLLAYGQGDWTTIDQDQLEVPIGSVTGLQTQLNTIPDGLYDLDDVKIVGTPSEGDALVYQSGFWSRGTAGASTLGDLDDVNTTGAGVGSTITFNGSTWEISGSELPADDIYYHNRYATEAETLRSGATATVELYYTAQADGDGYAESAESDTPATGYDIRRKLYYAESAQSDPDTGTWVQFATIPDDTTFASAKATLLAYLKERTGGTVPISLKMTWEEVSQAAYLLDQSYGSGAEAAYSTRQLRNAATDCMVIRRASDSTTQTIGFDGSGNIDESAIETFCTGTTCTVVTWKDQSGNGNDATQATPANQPTIYTGGALVKDGGKLALDFDGLANNFTSTITNVSQSFDVYTVHNFNTTPTATQRLYDSDNGGRITRGSNSTANNFAFAGTVLSWSPQQSGQVQETTVYNGVSSIVRVSGTQSASGDAGTNSTGTDFVIGSDKSGTTQYIDGQLQEIILFDNSKSTPDRTSIESNIGDYFTQNTPLLDTYSGAAAAYSLRKLRTAYTGSAIRVRRASDNAEQDIGFNVFGELDTVSLASFCSGTNGFVAKWYDQSGSANDATQTTTASQPKIYDSVTGVVTENGKPAVDNTNGGYFGLGSTITLTDFNIFSVVNTVNSGAFYGYGTYIGNRATTNQMIWERVNNIAIRAGGGDVQMAATSVNGQKLANALRASNVTGYFQNGTDIGTNNTATGNFQVANILDGYSGGGVQASGNFQEIVIYNSDQSTNRTAIEDNINTFYSIY